MECHELGRPEILDQGPFSNWNLDTDLLISCILWLLKLFQPIMISAKRTSLRRFFSDRLKGWDEVLMLWSPPSRCCITAPRDHAVYLMGKTLVNIFVEFLHSLSHDCCKKGHGFGSNPELLLRTPSLPAKRDSVHPCEYFTLF